MTEAVVRLIHSPRQRRLVVLGYPDIFAAADAVPSLLRHPLLALEGFDGMLVDQMVARPLNVEHLELLPPGRGWLLAELGHDDPLTADALTEAFIADLPAGVEWRRYDDRERQARAWLIRESGLGATALAVDGTHNSEGWEDAAVAPADLGRYLRALSALWARVRLHRARCTGTSGRAARTRATRSTSRRRRGCAPIARSSSAPPTSSSRSAARCRASTATARRAASCWNGCTGRR